MTDLDRLATHATRIAWAIHDQDPADVWAELANLDRLTLEQLCCALAAMVDVDKTPAELLAWTSQPATSTHQYALHVVTCGGCQTLFATKDGRRRYCSPLCLKARRRRSWRERATTRHREAA